MSLLVAWAPDPPFFGLMCFPLTLGAVGGSALLRRELAARRPISRHGVDD